MPHARCPKCAHARLPADQSAPAPYRACGVMLAKLAATASARRTNVARPGTRDEAREPVVASAAAVPFHVAPAVAWMHRLFSLILLLCCWVGAGAQTNAKTQGRWWLGFIDLSDRAFLEIPAEPRSCAERDRLVGRTPASPGAVLLSARSAAAEFPAGARLVAGVSDFAGGSQERVFPRVAAVVRDDENIRASQLQACWFLAEAGAERPGYRAQEDRLAVGVHPPRPLSVRVHEDNWRSYGGSPGTVGADNRFLAEAEAPGWVRELVGRMLPGADQLHAQAFSAVQSAGGEPERFWLIGGIRGSDRDPALPNTFETLNMIVGAGAERRVFFQAGPSGGIGRNRAGSFIAQVVASVDLDGDGVEELVLRARHYAGGSLLVLRRDGSGFAVARRGGYEGE